MEETCMVGFRVGVLWAGEGGEDMGQVREWHGGVAGYVWFRWFG